MLQGFITLTDPLIAVKTYVIHEPMFYTTTVIIWLLIRDVDGLFKPSFF